MLVLKYINEAPQEVISKLKKKNFEATEIVNKIIELDSRRRSVQMELDNKLSNLNSISKTIGQLMAEKKEKEAEAAKNSTVTIKEEIKTLQQVLKTAEEELNSQLVLLPNIPDDQVPEGASAEHNVLVRKGGQVPEIENGLPHWELGTKYKILDFDLGTKITGAGFPVFIDKGARLQRALIGFFLDENSKVGYKEVLPPLMVNEASAFGTGQLPDKEGQMYHMQLDNYFLVPTAEVPVTNIFRDMILDESELPLKYTAYTPCFRREAGSYGKDVRGLNRVHQFDKVEIVQIQTPEKSNSALDEMVAHVEYLVKMLELPYRIVKLCGGDMGFASAITYDFEVYCVAQKRWLEVSSVSNFGSFQANRLKLRYRNKENKKVQLAHTLNGSALALPRIVAALLENNQTSSGIVVPHILRRYTKFEKID